MRLTKTFTGVVVANLLMTILTVMATRNSRNARQHGSPLGRRKPATSVALNVAVNLPAPATENVKGTNSEITSLLSGSWNGNPDVLRNFTPTPPSPEEVECQIQVKRIEYVGGRCIRLAGIHSMSACQAGSYLDPFSYDCQTRSGAGRGRFPGRGFPVRRRPFGRNRRVRVSGNRNNGV